MKNDDNLISVFQFSRSKIANGNVSREKKNNDGCLWVLL